MSLYDRTPEIEALLRSGPLEYCQVADVYLDSGTVHYSNMFHEFILNVGDSEAAIVYQPLGTRIIPPSDYSASQSLDDTALELRLDSSRITDSTDPIGALIDNPLNRRRVRLRSVLFSPNTGRTVPLWVHRVRLGVMDGSKDQIQDDRESILTLRIRSGAFAALERLNWTNSHADQQELYPGDTGFQRMAALADTVLPWRGNF